MGFFRHSFDASLSFFFEAAGGSDVGHTRVEESHIAAHYSE
jgi:hypothetical protein